MPSSKRISLFLDRFFDTFDCFSAAKQAKKVKAQQKKVTQPANAKVMLRQRRSIE